jgi:hypothetical protein
MCRLGMAIQYIPNMMARVNYCSVEASRPDNHTSATTPQKGQAPEVFEYLRKKRQYARGALQNIEAIVEKQEKILNEVEQRDGVPARRKVEEMWSLAMKMIYQDPEWAALPDNARYDVSIGILSSLEDASGKGTLSDWDSPITKLPELPRKPFPTTQS